MQRIIPEVEFHQNRYARELGEVVTPHCRWLDLGAGTRFHWGWIGPSLDELGSRADFVVGCDVVAPHLASNAQLSAAVVADIGALPLADASFELVSANMVLEHLDDPARVFAEVARVLAPGGRFVFVTPNRRHPAIWLASSLLSPARRRALAEKVEGRDSDDIFLTHYRANAVGDLRHWTRKAGLTIRRLEAFPSFPIMRRPLIAVTLESLFIRAQSRGILKGLSSNLIGVFEKPAR
ncbi:MAG TPA: methyltransferase domain-containing protein [Gemmatimonadaceae bacterium]|nr:methyltransferase domain-containing protein [Gemmatimonadaceae bacterium]